MYPTITYFAKYFRRFKDWAMDNLEAIGIAAGFLIIVAGAVLLAWRGLLTIGSKKRSSVVGKVKRLPECSVNSTNGPVVHDDRG